MTGRAMGRCAGYDTPGFATTPMGWGGGAGMGRGGRGAGGGGGRGFRNRYYATGLTGWQRAQRGWPAWGWSGSWDQAPVQAGVYQGPYGPGSADTETQTAFLRQRADALEQELASIRSTLSDLEQGAGGSAPSEEA